MSQPRPKQRPDRRLRYIRVDAQEWWRIKRELAELQRFKCKLIHQLQLRD